ncbi:ATP-binding protein [Actinokineospora alba]|uniref:ATP-binding protein n=1 Tax=Actinokineospora alba TaxID=504798 RepID=UPI00105BF432|nr:LuxR C-terminal-related transcriptional regulator [Actinokineospora alba]
MTRLDQPRLPVDVTSFVGRGAELADIRRLLGASRLVTLTGPGGVGKTRLALRVAEQVGRTFGGRVWLVELAELRDPALLAHTVAAQLDLADHAQGDIADALLEHLADAHVLLVLDNCEHLVDAVAKLVDRITRAAPRVHVLATSRESLGVVGEAGFVVPPLPVPDPEAVTSAAEVLRYDGTSLLIDRARAVRSDFHVDDHNYAAVAALCRWLDGIPLAIELAAVRLRSLSAEEIVDRLGDRFRLLTLGRRFGPARHQTLQATVEWSHALCTPAEQTMWAKAALFPGGLELDAVEAVVVGDDLPGSAVIDVLDSLVDKSILSTEGGEHTRYVMLESLRDFGLRQLDAEESATLRRRHRDFYADLVATLRLAYLDGSGDVAMARILRERGNLRAALEFCATEPGEARAGMRMAAGLLAYWSAKAAAEGARWLDRLLAADPTPSRERAQALCDRAWLPVLRPGQSASGFLDEAEQVVEELKLHSGLESILIQRSRAAACLYEGRPAAAAEILARVLTWFETWEPSSEWDRAYRPYALLSCRIVLALAHSATGEPRQAEALLREALPVAAEHGHTSQRAVGLWNLGMLRLEAGETAEAAELARECLRLARDIDDQTCVADGLRLLCSIAAAEGDATHAALLWGATAEADQANAAMIISGWESDVYARHRALAHDAIGEESFDAAYRLGAGLTTAEAIAVALDERPARAQRLAKLERTLTRRQNQVADLIAEGKSNREIADALTISVRTAESHVDHILSALGFSTRAQIATWVASGRGEPPPP